MIEAGEGILLTYDAANGRWVAKLLPDAQRPSLYTTVSVGDSPLSAVASVLSEIEEEPDGHA